MTLRAPTPQQVSCTTYAEGPQSVIVNTCGKPVHLMCLILSNTVVEAETVAPVRQGEGPAEESGMSSATGSAEGKHTIYLATQRTCRILQSFAVARLGRAALCQTSWSAAPAQKLSS